MSTPQPTSEASATFSSDAGYAGFSKSAKQLLIITTVVGGTFVVAILIYALYQRQRRANVQRRRHRRTSTITDPALDGPKYDTTALPIYRQTEYTVCSAQAGRGSLMNMSKIFKPAYGSTSHPNPLESSPHISKARQVTPPPPRTPRKQTRSKTNDRTLPRDESPPRTPEQEPEMITRRTVIARPDSAVLPTPATTGPTTHPFQEKLYMEGDDDSDSPPPSPASTIFRQNPQDRWSWTNSQAPTTPRMPTVRGSLLGMPPPLRPVSAWIRNQPTRIEEESQTVPKITPQLLRKLSLQAQNGLNRSRSVLSGFRKESK